MFVSPQINHNAFQADVPHIVAYWAYAAIFPLVSSTLIGGLAYKAGFHVWAAWCLCVAWAGVSLAVMTYVVRRSREMDLQTAKRYEDRRNLLRQRLQSPSVSETTRAKTEAVLDGLGAQINRDDIFDAVNESLNGIVAPSPTDEK